MEYRRGRISQEYHRWMGVSHEQKGIAQYPIAPAQDAFREVEEVPRGPGSRCAIRARQGSELLSGPRTTGRAGSIAKSAADRRCRPRSRRTKSRLAAIQELFRLE